MTNDVEALPEPPEEPIGLVDKPVVLSLGNLAGNKLLSLATRDADVVQSDKVGFTVSTLKHMARQIGGLKPETVIWVPRQAKQNKEPVRLFAEGRLAIDEDRKEVKVDDTDIAFTRREFGLLTFLISNKRQVLTRAQIYEGAWSLGYAHNVDQTVTEHVRRVRKNLGHLAWTVGSVRGFGYMFDDSPERDPANQTQP